MKVTYDKNNFIYQNALRFAAFQGSQINDSDDVAVDKQIKANYKINQNYVHVCVQWSGVRYNTDMLMCATDINSSRVALISQYAKHDCQPQLK